MSNPEAWFWLIVVFIATMLLLARLDMMIYRWREDRRRKKIVREYESKSN